MINVQGCLNESNVRSRARTALLRTDPLFGCQHRHVEVRVRPKSLDSSYQARGCPEGYPPPSEYVRWLCEEGYLEPFAYLRDEWVWRPVIRRVLAGPIRAERSTNILLFERTIAEQLDDLEQEIADTVRKMRTTFNVEVVAPHAFGLRLTCERIRWRAFDHRLRTLNTVYLDVPERRSVAASSGQRHGSIVMPGILLRSAQAVPSTEARPERKEPHPWQLPRASSERDRFGTVDGRRGGS